MPFRVFVAYEQERAVRRAEERLDTTLGISHALGQRKDEPMSEGLRRDLALARIPHA